MELSHLSAVSPIDGRYGNKCSLLRPIFSEFGLIRHRVIVEIRWLQALASHPSIPEVPGFSESANNTLEDIITEFCEQDARRVKAIEKTTNHDVKAVEYFLKEKVAEHQELMKVSEFFHFACTSEDINNLSYALMLKTARDDLLLAVMEEIILTLQAMAKTYARIPMLCRSMCRKQPVRRGCGCCVGKPMKTRPPMLCGMLTTSSSSTAPSCGLLARSSTGSKAAAQACPMICADAPRS